MCNYCTSYTIVISAGLRTGQTGQLPRGLQKKGPPQNHIFLKYSCIVVRTVYVIGAEQVENYWLSVLKRLISVIKFPCERGLALRGENEIMGSAANGNYLGMLELLAQYDDFLKQHIQMHANLGSGHTNYLSSTICEELVQLMGKRVGLLDEIVSRIKRSRYYSVTLDATEDDGHVDQLTLVYRFMENTTPVERFVTFMPNQEHTAEEMFDGLMQFLDTHRIGI